MIAAGRLIPVLVNTTLSSILNCMSPVFILEATAKCMFKRYYSTMYCSSMWFDGTATSTKKLKIAYKKALGGY